LNPPRKDAGIPLSRIFMSNCPTYYLLADGTEFVDFFHEKCIGHLFTLHPSAAHAIQSAMEHRFRMGWKTEDTGHDILAMRFWTAKALEFVRKTVSDIPGRVMAVQQIEHVTHLVDEQREIKRLVDVN
jgi:hypothetical protein